MPVYKRTYSPYRGAMTPTSSRFWVLTRFAAQRTWRSRFIYSFLLVCFVYPAICLTNIYLQHNLEVVKTLQFSINKLFPIDAGFFFTFLDVQAGWGFLLTLVLGVGLISPDLSNNALPLYLCRPIGRWDYVLGKLMALVIPLSLITWIPGLFLFSVQSYYEGIGWFFSHWQVGVTLLLGSGVMILVYGLLCLAASAWVKWRMVAGGILLGGVTIFRGIGLAINKTFDVEWGYCLNLRELFNSLWANLLGIPQKSPLAIQDSCGVLLLVVGLAIYLLSRKIRACEVVA